MSDEPVRVTCDVTWRSTLPGDTTDERRRRDLDGETRRELRVLIARVEAVDWSDVPGVSAATAAAFATALERALEVSR